MQGLYKFSDINLFNELPCTHNSKYTSTCTDTYILGNFTYSIGEQMPALRIMSGNNDQYSATYNRNEPETVPWHS